MDGLTGHGAAELARQVRAGDTSPPEVVDAYIARIEAVELHINADHYHVRRGPDGLLRRLTEAGVPAGAPPPRRVPITVKRRSPWRASCDSSSDRTREHVADRTGQRPGA